MGFKAFQAMQDHCNKNPDETTTDQEIGWNNQFFDAVKGIGSQALSDFKSISKKHCMVYHPLLGIVSIC